MAIDLSRFAVAQEAIVPIVAGWGQIHTRKIWKANQADGWYCLSLGDKIDVIRPATPLEIDRALRGKKIQRFYALGTEGVPLNFDQVVGGGQSKQVHFLELPAWDVAKTVLWEDGRYYFLGADTAYERKVLQQVKQAFESDQGLDTIRGVTPELRYYFLVLSLQRQSLREFEEMERLRLTEEERRKRVAEFETTFAGRLQSIVRGAGGELVRWEKYSNGYMVTWKVRGTTQLVKSHIKDDLRIISAGFCLSGEDQDHNMESIIQLAKMFQTEVVNPHTGRTALYITRE